MKTSGIIITAVLTLLICACQKRDYPPTLVQNNQQEIFFDGTVDNEPLNLTIGRDNYYCYSSCSQDAESLYVFEGSLKKFDCGECPLSLKVKLFDYRQRNLSAQVPVDSVFSSGMRAIAPGFSKPVRLKLSANSGKQVSSVRWLSDEGWHSALQQPALEFSQAGLHTVSLTVRSASGCENTIVNKIFAGGSAGVFACSISSQTSAANGGNFSAVLTGGKAPYSYSWQFGDGYFSSLAATSHNFQYAGGYPVNLVVTDAEGHRAECGIIFVAGKDLSSCSLGMDITNLGTRNALLNATLIEWRDKNNIVFRSDSALQQADNLFEILDSKPFAANEAGQKGRLLTLRVNALLSSGSKTIRLKTENMQIAVSYR